MKSKLMLPQKLIIGFIFLACTSSSFGAVFTATASGNWMSSSTWAGGTAPSLDISGDQIVIPSGVTVSLTNSLTINGSLASLAIAGMLTSAANDTITLGMGAITGSGNINAGYLIFDAGSVLAFTGTVVAEVLISWPTSLQVAANVTVSNSLALLGGLSVQTGGILTMDSGSTIYIVGGELLSGGGSLVLSNNYNVNYMITSAIAGLELSGTGLYNVTVNVPTGDSVELSNNLTVNGTLDLISGTLALNGRDLSIAGDIAAEGIGSIASTSSSNITVNTLSSPTGPLVFSYYSNEVGGFIVNVGGNNGTLVLGSDLEIDGNLQFMHGTLNMSSYGLGMGTSGSISGASNLSYIILDTIGYLRFTMNAVDTGWTLFPIGTSLTYAPVSLHLNQGSATGNVYVSVQNGIWSGGTSGSDLSLTEPTVNVSWLIEPDSANNTSMNLQAMWSTSMEVNGFNPGSAYVSHFINGNWDVSTIGSASVLSSGMFSLERDNINSFSPFAVFGSSATSLRNISVDNRFVVYPNPASDNLIIDNVRGIDGVYLDIIDVTGQVVATYKLTDYTSNVSLKGLSAGSYFAKLYNSDFNTIKKFMKM